jgi:hypothetical protein
MQGRKNSRQKCSIKFIYRTWFLSIILSIAWYSYRFAMLLQSIMERTGDIDPVVFSKICLVGYLNNINSDRNSSNIAQIV